MPIRPTKRTWQTLSSSFGRPPFASRPWHTLPFSLLQSHGTPGTFSHEPRKPCSSQAWQISQHSLVDFPVQPPLSAHCFANLAYFHHETSCSHAQRLLETCFLFFFLRLLCPPHQSSLAEGNNSNTLNRSFVLPGCQMNSIRSFWAVTIHWPTVS